MSSKRIVTAFVVVAVVAVAIWWYAFRKVPNNQPPVLVTPPSDTNWVLSDDPMPPPQSAAKPLETAAPTMAEMLAVLPPSLQDAGRPADLDLDENGALIVNIKVRNLFDFYLAALGEDTEAMVIERIAHHVRNLPSEAQRRVLDILDGYLGYRQAMDDYLAANQQRGAALGQSLSDDELAAKKRAVMDEKLRLRDLRSQYMDAETITAFYAREDQLDDYTLRRYVIEDDPLLSDAEKDAAMEDALSTMPEWFQKQTRITQSVSDIRALDSQGLSAVELARARHEAVGPEAVKRLEVLDQKRAAWQKRVDDYQAELNRLEAFWGGADSANYNAAVEKLRTERFSPMEQIRLRGQADLRRERAEKTITNE